jgi:hypothetical protein
MTVGVKKNEEQIREQLNRIMKEPSKGWLIFSIIGFFVFLAIFIIMGISYDNRGADFGAIGAFMLLLLIADIVNIINAFASSAKYKKLLAEMIDINERMIELESPATINFSRGMNDGMQKALKLEVYNNGDCVASLAVGEDVALETKANINIITVYYTHPVTDESIPIKGKLILELSDNEQVNVSYDRKKLVRAGV